MRIRLAGIADMEESKRIFEAARQYMRSTGNSIQWGDGYPEEELIRYDIEQGQFYVWEDEATGEIYGVFALIFGIDPTYVYIDHGEWLNDEPYGAIHRVASDGRKKGLLADCVAFCRTKTANLRIDTHEINLTMQGAIRKQGFQYCGHIFKEDGTTRLAYQLEVKDHE